MAGCASSHPGRSRQVPLGRIRQRQRTDFVNILGLVREDAVLRATSGGYVGNRQAPGDSGGVATLRPRLNRLLVLSYTAAVFLLLLTAALAVWFLFWPESASRVPVSLNRPFGRRVPPRPLSAYRPDVAVRVGVGCLDASLVRVPVQRVASVGIPVFERQRIRAPCCRSFERHTLPRRLRSILQANLNNSAKARRERGAVAVDAQNAPTATGGLRTSCRLGPDTRAV